MSIFPLCGLKIVRLYREQNWLKQGCCHWLTKFSGRCAVPLWCLQVCSTKVCIEKETNFLLIWCLIASGVPRPGAGGWSLSPGTVLTPKLYVSQSGVRVAVRCCLSICTFRPNRICTVGLEVSDRPLGVRAPAASNRAEKPQFMFRAAGIFLMSTFFLINC